MGPLLPPDSQQKGPLASAGTGTVKMQCTVLYGMVMSEQLLKLPQQATQREEEFESKIYDSIYMLGS